MTPLHPAQGLGVPKHTRGNADFARVSGDGLGIVWVSLHHSEQAQNHKSEGFLFLPFDPI